MSAELRIYAHLVHHPEHFLVVDVLRISASEFDCDLAVSVSLLRTQPDCLDFVFYSNIIELFGLLPALGLYGIFVGRLLKFRYGKQLRELYISFVFFALEERDDGVGLFARSDFRLFSTKASNFFL